MNLIISPERLRRGRVRANRLLEGLGVLEWARGRFAKPRIWWRVKEFALARERALEERIGSLRAFGRKAGVTQAPRSRAPRVLLFTGLGSHHYFPLVDGLLFHALQQRGAEATAVLCGGALPACEVELSTEQRPGALLRRGRPKKCGSCFRHGSTIYGALSVPFLTLEGVLDPSVRSWADEVANSIPHAEYFDYWREGVPIGSHVKATIMRYSLSGRMGDSSQDRAIARRFLVSALLILVAAQRLIKQYEPDVVVAHHGIYNMPGIFCDVARAHGCRVVAWNPGYRVNTAIFSHGKTYHHEMIEEPISRWADKALNAEERTRLREYLASRHRGGMDWITYHPRPIEDRETLVGSLGLDPTRPIIGLFTNVNWDAQIAYPRNAFSDQLEWLVQTIEHFGLRPEVQLVIRVHPAEVKGWPPSRQGISDEIAQRFPVLPCNVRVIPPESHLSSYTLIELMTAGIIFGTKVGLEMVVRGLPVVVAGESWIRGKGFSCDAYTPEEYREILNRVERLPRLSREQVELAERYAYHFFFRRMIPFVMSPGPDAIGTGVDSAFADPNELQPGRSPGLDVICEGILRGTPFEFE